MNIETRALTAALPPIGEAVWALFNDTWILAYLDYIGVWRDLADNSPLQAPTEGIHTWLPRHYRRPAFVSSTPSGSAECNSALLGCGFAALHCNSRSCSQLASKFVAQTFLERVASRFRIGTVSPTFLSAEFGLHEALYPAG